MHNQDGIPVLCENCGGVFYVFSLFAVKSDAGEFCDSNCMRDYYESKRKRRGIVGRLIDSVAPTGYQDENGFHYGTK